ALPPASAPFRSAADRRLVGGSAAALRARAGPGSCRFAQPAAGDHHRQGQPGSGGEVLPADGSRHGPVRAPTRPRAQRATALQAVAPQGPGRSCANRTARARVHGRNPDHGGAGPHLRAAARPQGARRERHGHGRSQDPDHDLAHRGPHAGPAAGHSPAGRPAPGVRGGHGSRPVLQQPHAAHAHRGCAVDDAGVLRPARQPLLLLRRPGPVRRHAGERRAARDAADPSALRRCTGRSDAEGGTALLRLRSTAGPQLLPAAGRPQLAGRHAGRVRLHGGCRCATL
ncbi:MAG: hypothetical protein AVDCRST_MAG51-658, partial [uncultured Ramlibacter sp.]